MCPKNRGHKKKNSQWYGYAYDLCLKNAPKFRVPNKWIANLLSRNPSPKIIGPSNFKSSPPGDGSPHRWSPTRLELAEGSGNATLRHRGGSVGSGQGERPLFWPGKTTMPSSKNWRILFVLGLGPLWLLALWGLGIHLIESTKQKWISEPARKCMPFNIPLLKPQRHYAWCFLRCYRSCLLSLQGPFRLRWKRFVPVWSSWGRMLLRDW